MSSSGDFPDEEIKERIFQTINAEYEKIIEESKLAFKEYEQDVEEERLESDPEYQRKKYYDQSWRIARELEDAEILYQIPQEEEVVNTLFQETIVAIKNRVTSISSMELDLSTLRREAPTLLELSMRALAKDSESIESLSHFPDYLGKKLSNLFSDSGKLNLGFVKLMIQDSPTEVSVRNCVDLKEEDMINILCDCDRDSLKVLNLDLCGSSITENVLTGFLQRTSNLGFPSLTTLSLRGAFCLTDNALALISRSAPKLRFINLELCSLTSRAIEILANSFESTLRGLNIGGCIRIRLDYTFRRSLVRFTELNYLSVAGLQWVYLLIEFIRSRGSNLTDLSLGSCYYVTEELISAIGRCCPKLETLDISDLDDLTDASLGSIAVGCRVLNSVILTRTRFSDEAVAAFIEVSGSSLTQLGLSKVGNVGNKTAISLGKVCKKLQYLDLSWCLDLTEEDLRWIVRCCSSLKSLKLFGWTQVSDKFLEELLGSHIRITGSKTSSVYAHLDDPFPSVDDKFFS